MPTVERVALLFAIAGNLYPAGQTYELRGRLAPESPAAVSLFGATTPFHAETPADEQGRFRFRALAPGEYIVAVFIPGKGEVRQTIEIGPGTADDKGRIELTIPIADASAEALPDRAKVSSRELSIPDSARREYAAAQEKLSKRDVADAVAHLQRAVAIAPQFTSAWNNLGTIAYQARQYARADECFRKALEQNPSAYEPLVNLGGVLLNEGKPDEALPYNRFAVLSRPHDALANSQLGMNYFMLRNLESSQEYLEVAKRIDPAHFSYPQLTLARIHLLRKERTLAAQELRDFLHRHPDAPESTHVRQQLAEIEQEIGGPSVTSR
ncbi:MAG TPA: tetratricopeptide repeat protein [Bryobacteraceae bacterium]|nr:tetratricopeptide repeat protein [Bryobacteraceae bacterium]